MLLKHVKSIFGSGPARSTDLADRAEGAAKGFAEESASAKLGSTSMEARGEKAYLCTRSRFVCLMFVFEFFFDKLCCAHILSECLWCHAGAAAGVK